jgi:hypothetical protein
METGLDALNAGREAAIDALKHPARPWSGAD